MNCSSIKTFYMESSIRECPCCGDMILGRRKVVIHSEKDKISKDSKSEYTFNCPKCNLVWSWYDTDPRRILIDNYRKRYINSIKVSPKAPTKKEIKSNPLKKIWPIICFIFFPDILLFLLHILAYIAYFCTFCIWDPTDTTWGYITGYSYWAFIIVGIIFVIMICKYGWDKVYISMNYQRRLKKQKRLCAENEKYNEDIKKKLLQELNEILSSKGLILVADL